MKGYFMDLPIETSQLPNVNISEVKPSSPQMIRENFKDNTMREAYLNINNIKDYHKGFLIRFSPRETYIVTKVIGDNYLKYILRCVGIKLRYNQVKIKLWKIHHFPYILGRD